MTTCFKNLKNRPSGVRINSKGEGIGGGFVSRVILAFSCFLGICGATASAQDASNIVVDSAQDEGYALDRPPGGGTFLVTATGKIIETDPNRAGITTEAASNIENGWNITVDGSVTSAYHGVYLQGPDTLEVGPDASVTGYAGVYVWGSYDVVIENFGTLTATRDYSILRSGGGPLTFVNHEGALAHGAVNSSGPMSRVDNAGTIWGGLVSSVILADGSTLINRESGKIQGLSDGVWVNGRGNVENAGEIRSDPDTAYDPDWPYFAVYLDRGSVKNSSTGLIEGHYGVRFGTGWDMEQGLSSLDNSGTIAATARNAAAFVMVEEASLINTATGKLLGHTEGVYIRDVTNADIVNAGLISGVDGIALIGDGERTIFNSGSIVANGGKAIYKAGGSFNLVLQTGSEIVGEVNAESDDSLRLEGEGAENDALLGFGSVVMAGSAWALEGTVTGDSLAVELGSLTLKSNATFNEASVAAGSALFVDGVLSGPVDVLGKLGGYGEVGSVTIAAGGVHALGDVIGTQIVNGDYINYGTLVIKATPDGADSIVVRGGVDLTGATLELLLTPEYAAGWKINNGPFTIIAKESAGGVTGTFGDVDSNLLFLDVAVDYAGGDGNDVTVELTRNDIEFGSIGATRNQRAVGRALDSLPDGHPVWNAIALSSGDEEMARQSFDSLSGEIHASVKTVLIEDSAHARNAANDRIRAGFAAVGASMAPVLAYGSKGPALASPSASHGLAAWSQAFGSWGAADGNGNAASLDYGAGGLFIGADAMLANWRIGLMAGHSRTTFDTDALNASGSAQTYHLGLYGGTQWGNLGFRSGLVHSWHDLETKRTAIMGASVDHSKADYSAGTLQAFGELGFGIDTAIADIEAFANVAHASLRVGRFMEDGGASALSASSSNTDTTFTTLGLRASIGLAVGNINATARGMMGWRHAFGDITPLSTHAFDAGDAFTVAGVPIAENAAVLEAGLDINLSEATSLAVDYQGQFAAGSREQAFNAHLSFEF